MKVRIGFVSNSSTTSFILLGYSISKKEAWEYLKKLKNEGKIKEEMSELNLRLDFNSFLPPDIEGFFWESYVDDDIENIFVGLLIDSFDPYGQFLSLDVDRIKKATEIVEKQNLFENKEIKFFGYTHTS
jgi:hypothetical protein